MFKGLYVDKPEHIIIKEDQEPQLQASQVRIRTEFAAIKHCVQYYGGDAIDASALLISLTGFTAPTETRCPT